MHAGHNSKYTNRERYIPVNNILQKLWLDFCESLPAAHAITGCDTTSSFYKIGKRIVYNKLVEHVKNILQHSKHLVLAIVLKVTLHLPEISF